MGISIGLVGLGQFGKAFAELYNAHPAVSRIALCDREPERIRTFAEKESFSAKFDEKDAYATLDDICRSDLDALVIITQPWLHAPQAAQAMEAGKHVYSAVPIHCVPDGDEILDWCDRLVRTCETTGMRYMLGETTYYHAESMFCRRKAAEGAFGRFVYAEGEYMHDVDANCNLREVRAAREASAAGKEWHRLKQTYIDRGLLTGPMHYPTHSTSGPICVMGAHAVRATAYGTPVPAGDDYFDENAFSNEVALFQMSNGAALRICEFRECGGRFHGSETFRIMGTRGSYAENVWRDNGRSDVRPAHKLEETTLTVEEMRDPLPPEVTAAFKAAMQPDADPDDDFQPKGHGGSHPYLVHEFCDSVINDRQPAINVWEAVRYMAPGVMAHKSCLKDGETLDVPDWGDGG